MLSNQIEIKFNRDKIKNVSDLSLDELEAYIKEVVLKTLSKNLATQGSFETNKGLFIKYIPEFRDNEILY